MLEPEHRSLLLDNLRPPAGYRLDRAIGTTFSLDLDALLTVPLAFAMFDVPDDGPPDVIALLEATRRYAGRVSLFCQAGRISLPRSYSKVLANVEGSIHEVAPRPRGLFHPKVWALRFTADGADPLYRLLVLSRNLTFDRSWDVIVRLEGERAPQGERSETAKTNRALIEFLEGLPTLTVQPLPKREQRAIDDFAKELRHVKFAAPEDFSSVSFRTSGLPASPWSPFEDHSRALVISPFLAPGLLEKVTSSGRHHVLISRAEALDRIPDEILAGFEKVFVMDASVQDPELASDAELTGLHAKVFVVEHRGQVVVYAGSANATEAGFGGNVEFLACLHGPRYRVGIDTVLSSGTHEAVGFSDLLTPYLRRGPARTEETAAERLERELDELRHSIAAVPMTLTVNPRRNDDFDLRLETDEPVLPGGVGASLRCRPLTLRSGHAHEVAPAEPLDVVFPGVPFSALTPFVVFELRMTAGKRSRTVSFVVNAKLDGAPDDRHQRILSSLLDDRTKVLRYLLFLLAEPDGPDTGAVETLRDAISGAKGDGRRPPDLPLLEAMLHSLADDPTRLDHVNRLIEDLSTTPSGRRLLPDGLGDIWPAIWQARQEADRG